MDDKGRKKKGHKLLNDALLWLSERLKFIDGWHIINLDDACHGAFQLLIMFGIIEVEYNGHDVASVDFHEGEYVVTLTWDDDNDFISVPDTGVLAWRINPDARNMFTARK